MLKIRGLGRPGLDPVDLDVAPGECVAISGPSGAGKSILLRAIADLDPNEGQVSLKDQPREAMPAPDWRRRWRRGWGSSRARSTGRCRACRPAKSNAWRWRGRW